jgi:hypothetical protein
MSTADLEKGKDHGPVVKESREHQDGLESTDSLSSTDEDSAQKTDLPNRFPRALHRIFLWTKGPSPKKQHTINPFFPSIQGAPIKILDRLCRPVRWKIVAFLSVFVTWLILFAFLVRRNESPPQVEGFGIPKRLSCAVSPW